MTSPLASQRPLEAAGRKKGPPRTLLQELCASAKCASEFDGYASVRGFQGQTIRSAYCAKTANQQVAIGKTHGLCGGEALRKCPIEPAVYVLFNH